MAIHWLVFLRLRRTEIKTTYPAQKIVGVIIKKDYAGGTFIFCACYSKNFMYVFIISNLMGEKEY
jgi:hypothetical protein